MIDFIILIVLLTCIVLVAIMLAFIPRIVYSIWTWLGEQAKREDEYLKHHENKVI